MKVWTEDDIRDLLANNDRAVTRAVVALYKRQTTSEKASAITQEANGVGFNAYDARYLTWCAEWVMNTRRYMNAKHTEKARRMVMKYTRQLVDIANAQFAKQYEQEAVIDATTLTPDEEAQLARYGDW